MSKIATNEKAMKLRVMNVGDILEEKEFKLTIPDYQRQYKWTSKNVLNLINDLEYICKSRNEYKKFKYRMGTVILYHNKDGEYEIVDGQQRIITLSLLKYCLDDSFDNFVINKSYDKNQKDTLENIHKNYSYIMERLSNYDNAKKNEIIKALTENMDMVVIILDENAGDEISAAFQLFDSQNSRGKDLNPHDLLKAYHLREMNCCKSEKLLYVEKWEELQDDDIKNLFSYYLFPIYNWISNKKTHIFTKNDIEVYKGVNIKNHYRYVKRILKSEPIYQLNEKFMAGKSFFDFVNHYLEIKNIIENEININFETRSIKEIINNIEYLNNAGFNYAINLFKCVLICYYDKFGEIDNRIIKFLYRWAMQIRIDMRTLGYDTINNYAIGSDNKKYTYHIDMFNKIFNIKESNELFIASVKLVTNDNDKKDWYNKLSLI